MKNELENLLKKNIRVIPDFPKKGIMFQDIFSLIAKPHLLKKIVDEISKIVKKEKITKIVGIDARGFIFGTALGVKLSKPIVMARKPGKLPGELLSKSYSLEYGNNSLSIQRDMLNKYQTFAIVDDLLATGGTVKCIRDILIGSGSSIVKLKMALQLFESFISTEYWPAERLFISWVDSPFDQMYVNTPVPPKGEISILPSCAPLQ